MEAASEFLSEFGGPIDWKLFVKASSESSSELKDLIYSMFPMGSTNPGLIDPEKVYKSIMRCGIMSVAGLKRYVMYQRPTWFFGFQYLHDRDTPLRTSLCGIYRLGLWTWSITPFPRAAYGCGVDPSIWKVIISNVDDARDLASLCQCSKNWRIALRKHPTLWLAHQPNGTRYATVVEYHAWDLLDHAMSRGFDLAKWRLSGLRAPMWVIDKIIAALRPTRDDLWTMVMKSRQISDDARRRDLYARVLPLADTPCISWWMAVYLIERHDCIGLQQLIDTSSDKIRRALALPYGKIEIIYIVNAEVRAPPNATLLGQARNHSAWACAAVILREFYDDHFSRYWPSEKSPMDCPPDIVEACVSFTMIQIASMQSLVNKRTTTFTVL